MSLSSIHGFTLIAIVERLRLFHVRDLSFFF